MLNSLQRVILTKKADTLAGNFSIRSGADMDDMLINEGLDVISMLTPTGKYAEHEINLRKYGNDIVLEKPMDLRLDQADRVIKACDERNCQLYVVKLNRFNVPLINSREALEQGGFVK